MITTVTNNLHAPSRTLFDLMPVLDISEDFQSAGWANGPTQVEEFTKPNRMPSLSTLEGFSPATWANCPVQFEEFVQVEIPESGISIPKQLFNFRLSPNRKIVTLESEPNQDWPKILLQLEADAMDVYRVNCYEINPASQTLTAEMKFTRFVLSLGKLNVLKLNAPLRWGVVAEAIANEELKHLYRRAKFVRKLGFLEKVFHCKFDYPFALSRQLVFQVETLFRGITEGRFSVRLESLNLMVDPKTVDLSQPPWNGSGSIKQLVSEHETLFGTTLDTGPVWLETLHAGIGSYQAIRQIEQQVTHPVEALFGLLDHQITFCFERYANRSPKEREAKLKQYLHELSLEEPSNIYNLTLESLVADVTQEEADQLAMGWISIHRFPDCYCSQIPKLDVTKNAWCVPLWIKYPTGKGGAVTDLFVDASTGVVTATLPIAEIRTRGNQLAKRLLHASETALLQAGG